MQKWEHLIVECGKTGDGVWRPRAINGVAQKDWTKNNDIYLYLGQLGDAGWELLHVDLDTIAQASWMGTNKAQETAYRFFLKRPKP